MKNHAPGISGVRYLSRRPCQRTPQSSDWEQFKEILVMKCQRCFDDQRVVYRVSSDVINLRVCASCAAEARRLGLAVEVFSVGESKTLRGRSAFGHQGRT